MYAVNDAVDPLSPMLRDALATAKSLVPLKSLRHGFLEDLFLYAEPQSVMGASTLFELGSRDDQYIYLQSGSLKLIYPNGHEELLCARDTLAPVVHQQPRPCQAIAEEDSTVIRIDVDRVDRTLSWSQSIDYLLAELSLDRKNDGELDWVRTVLCSNLFFKVPPVNAENIFACLTPMVVTLDETVICQGDIGDCCYFLKEGSADVVQIDYDQQEHKIAEILAGRCFGEDALLSHGNRNASIRMNQDGLLMRLEKSDFLKLLQEPAVEEITQQDVDEKYQTPILIDVRTDAEYRFGHLAYSVNMPLDILALKKRLLSIEQTYIVYCDSGRRSRAAAWFLGKEGYDVVSLRGGLHEQQMLDRIVQDNGYILREGKLIPSEQQ